MDPSRFDRLSKSFAARFTRRGLLAGIGAGGISATALNEIPALAADGKTTCIYDFDGTIDVGPSSTLGATSEVSGELTITLASDGAIDSGKLLRQDGTSWPVVGQATGRAINLRFSVPKVGAFIAVGTGRHNVSDCTPAMAGPASGPLRQDAGSWRATLKSDSTIPAATATTATTAAAGGDTQPPSTGNTPTTSTHTPTATPTATSTPETSPTSPPECTLVCQDGGSQDPVSCTCICPNGLSSCIDSASAVGRCLDLSTDMANCGSCGAPCAADFPERQEASCAAGVCTKTCTHGLVTCSPDAVCKTFLNDDKAHCGVCDHACGTAAPTCVQGACVCNSDIRYDVLNCGACGHVCPAFAPSCDLGKCFAQAIGG